MNETAKSIVLPLFGLLVISVGLLAALLLASWYMAILVRVFKRCVAWLAM